MKATKFLTLKVYSYLNNVLQPWGMHHWVGKKTLVDFGDLNPIFIYEVYKCWKVACMHHFFVKE